MMNYELTEGRRGDFHLGQYSHLLEPLRPSIVILGILLTLLRVTNSIYIFKFVWLQGICESKMAAFKSFINKIDMNLAGQCCLIRNQRRGGIGSNICEHFTNV